MDEVVVGSKKPGDKLRLNTHEVQTKAEEGLQKGFQKPSDSL